jgi:hypothetical protein
MLKSALETQLEEGDLLQQAKQRLQAKLLLKTKPWFHRNEQQQRYLQ